MLFGGLLFLLGITYTIMIQNLAPWDRGMYGNIMLILALLGCWGVLGLNVVEWEAANGTDLKIRVYQDSDKQIHVHSGGKSVSSGVALPLSLGQFCIFLNTSKSALSTKHASVGIHCRRGDSNMWVLISWLTVVEARGLDVTIRDDRGNVLKLKSDPDAPLDHFLILFDTLEAGGLDKVGVQLRKATETVSNLEKQLSRLKQIANGHPRQQFLILVELVWIAYESYVMHRRNSPYAQELRDIAWQRLWQLVHSDDARRVTMDKSIVRGWWHQFLQCKSYGMLPKLGYVPPRLDGAQPWLTARAWVSKELGTVPGNVRDLPLPRFLDMLWEEEMPNLTEVFDKDEQFPPEARHNEAA